VGVMNWKNMKKSYLVRRLWRLEEAGELDLFRCGSFMAVFRVSEGLSILWTIRLGYCEVLPSFHVSLPLTLGKGGGVPQGGMNTLWRPVDVFVP